MAVVIGIIAVIVVIFFVLTLLSNYFYKLAIDRSIKPFLSGNANSDKPSPWVKENEINAAWMTKHEVEEIRITSHDGLQLEATYIPQAVPSNKVAILVHGYAGSRLDMLSYGRIYADKCGMNLLMPDNRGHGKSEGDYIGFGWHDRLDIIEWITYIMNRVGPDAEIILHGVSMGGATVLMVSGEELPPQVKGIVSDCAYTSAKEQLAYQLKVMYKLPSFPLLYTTDLLARKRAGYSFQDASAIKQVQKAKVPILFIHGDADTFVPTEMVHKLFEACESKKELYIVPTAEHAQSILVDRVGYTNKVCSFLAQLHEEQEKPAE